MMLALIARDRSLRVRAYERKRHAYPYHAFPARELYRHCSPEYIVVPHDPHHLTGITIDITTGIVFFGYHFRFSQIIDL
jgi:hypothetical protein